MVKGVIFDMDGLMFDTERLWDKMWEPACKALGLPLPEDLAAFSASCRGLAGDNLRSRCWTRSGRWPTNGSPRACPAKRA